MHKVIVNGCRLIKYLILISLLGLTYSSAADQYSQYITYLDCDNESIAQERDANKIYEPARGAGIESLSYSLDKKSITSVNEYRRILDKNGHVKLSPAIALRLESGWLAGSFSEFFGGELVFIDEEMKVTLLMSGVVFDMFEAPLGVVVITRESLLVGGGGNNIYLLTQEGKKFEAKKFFTLPETPLDAQKLENGGVLINMKSAHVVFTHRAELHRVQCESANSKGHRND